MTNLKIIQYPNPILKKKCSLVKKMDASFRQTVKEMIFLMQSERGLGLSAPQVGISEQFFVWKYWPSVVVNPIITKRKGRVTSEEGCLSIPDTIVKVPRAEEIWVEGYDIKGREFKKHLKDLPSIVFQHELNHLQGILITDYAKI